MTNLLLLILCFFVGVLARRTRALPEDSHRAINAWVMFVSLPALVLRAIHDAPLDGVAVAEAALLWLVFFVPAAVVWFTSRSKAWACVALCGGLCNTAFVGLPLLEALGGKQVLGVATVADQLGAFVALFVLGIPFAAAVSGARVSVGKVVRGLVTRPALWALVLAVVLKPVTFPPAFEGVLDRLAAMLSPLALASVGWSLDVRALKGNGVRLLTGLSWKLVAAPAMVCAILYLWRGGLGETERIVVSQAAMAPMVTAGVVAADYDLEPGLAAAFIALGVPLSLVTVPLWWQLLG